MSTKEITLPKFYKEFKSFRLSVGKRFDKVDERFEGGNKRFNSIDKRFDSVEEKLSSHTVSLMNIESKLDLYADMYFNNKEKIEGLNLRVANLGAK